VGRGDCGAEEAEDFGVDLPMNKSIQEKTIMPELSGQEISVPELNILQKSVSRFRDLVNEARLHHALFQQPIKFNLLCSAMDIIDDILFALQSYTKHAHDDQGLAYLEIFGVLQALCVQQDAVIELHKIIEGNSIDLENKYPEIKEVRDARIRVAGHPVGGRASSHFLVRYTVSKWGFELWKYDQTGGRTAQRVDILSLIKRNSRALKTTMGDLIAFIEMEDRKHKEKFMKSSLADIFRMSTYLSGKIFEGVSGKNPIGLVGSGSIKDMLKNFRSALDERGSHFQEAGFVVHDIPKIEYALSKFERYMKGDEAQNEDDAYILASFIQTELSRLVEIAKEIDDEYKK
jgi:hypothetical protein